MKRIPGQPDRRTMPVFLAAMLVTAGLMVACSDGGGPDPVDAIDDATADTTDPGTDPGSDTLVPPDDARIDATADLTPPDATDPNALELVAMGKERLAAGESLAAMDAFDRALDFAPGLQDAEWGLVLARFQSTVAMFGSLIGLIKMKEDPDAPRAMAFRDTTWPDHKGTVGEAIDSLHRAAVEQQARLDLLRDAADNPVFTLEGGLPLAMGDLPMMRLCCDWDRSDVHGISSFNHLMLAFASFLGSQNSDVSLDRIYELFKELPGITNVLTRLFDENPDLLGLLPDSGEATWREAGVHVAAAANAALEAARLMALDDGSGEPVATLADDGIAYLVLHGDFPGDRQELTVLWEGTGPSMKDVVEKVAAHLGGDAEARLSLDGDALVAIGVLVDIINRTVGFQAILDALGFQLPDIVGGFLDLLDPEDPDQLVGMLGVVLPMIGIQAGTIELDLATFFDTPFHLREFLPNAGPEPGTRYRTFLRSFECARGGAVLTTEGPTQTATLFMHDPSATDETISLDVIGYATPGGADEPFDIETVVLAPYEGFTGLYWGTLDLIPSEDASAADDGRLHLPEGGEIQAHYASTAHPTATVTIQGTLTEGLTPWDYGAACPDDTTPWDGPRFGEAEFADAVEIAGPGQSVPVSPIDADGKAGRWALMAFPSPSFAGLIWLKEGETFAPATQASFGALFGGVMAALEAF